MPKGRLSKVLLMSRWRSTTAARCLATWVHWIKESKGKFDQPPTHALWQHQLHAKWDTSTTYALYGTVNDYVARSTCASPFANPSHFLDGCAELHLGRCHVVMSYVVRKLVMEPQQSSLIAP